MIILFISAEIPQQQRFLFLADKRVQIVHSTGRDGDATLATFSVQGDVTLPAMAVHPSGSMDHQSSCISRLVVDVHAFYAEASLVAVAMFFRH